MVRLVSYLLLGLVLWHVADSTDVCSTCRCEESSVLANLKNVDCTRVNFLVVPPVTSWPDHTLSLDLSFNDITAVDVEMTYSKLSTLKLNNNKIEKVNSSAFGGLNSLKFLDLSHNVLTEFEGNEFYGLGSLKVLNISSNRIKALPDLIFNHFFDLEELSVSKNPITHVQKAHFVRVLNLKRLDLSNTKAYSLPADVFSGLKNLEYLDLSSNDFHQIPTDALRSAVHLKRLLMNENPVEGLDKTSFRRLKSLEVLEISYMDYLVSIDQQTFSDLTNLRVLEAKWNPKLSRVDKDAFAGLFNSSPDSIPALQEVSFEMGRLHTLDAKIFDCKTMQKLNLQKNPWLCDCKIKWIRECPISRVYTADVKCDSPAKLRNQVLFSVEAEELQCDHMMGMSAESIHHDRVIRLFSLGLGCAVLITLAFGIIFVLKWKSIKNWWRLKRRGPGPVYYVRTKTYPPET